MKTTTEYLATKFTHIGYNATDSHGSDGWWEEADSGDACNAQAEEEAKECNSDWDGPELEIVELSAISELDAEDFNTLVSQWGISRNNGWTTTHTDNVIHAEWARRDEPRIDGISARRILSNI